MPGRLRQRPLLAPAGDPAVDEPRVAREAVVGAEAEPLGRPRDGSPRSARRRARSSRSASAFPPGLFQVERQGRPPAQQEIVAQLALEAEVARLRPVDAQHAGAEIGEQHRAHRPRPDARELHDLDAGCSMSSSLQLAGERRDPGLGASQDQRVDIVGAFIGVDRFEVHHWRMTWNSSEMPLPPCMSRAALAMSSALPALLRLMG